MAPSRPIALAALAGQRVEMCLVFDGSIHACREEG
jgi:hypothetical protein